MCESVTLRIYQVGWLVGCITLLKFFSYTMNDGWGLDIKVSFLPPFSFSYV